MYSTPLSSQSRLITDVAIGTGTFTAVKDTLTDHPAIHQLRSAAGLCKATDLDAEALSAPLAERRIFGDATDQAALRFSAGLGSVPDPRGVCTRRFALALDSRNRFVAPLLGLAEPRGLGVLLLIKGAPDLLLGRCTKVVTGDDRVSSHPPDMATSIRELKDKRSSDGRRTEAHVTHEAQGGLTLMGFLKLIDPPHPDISEVMRTLCGAGISTLILRLSVTGDFGLTALTIAHQYEMVTKDIIHRNSALKTFPPETIVMSSGEKEKKKSSSAAAATPMMRTIPGAVLVLTGAGLMKLNDHQ
ncbi:Na/K ATPase alpha 1 subunit [Apiospora hydei]|uniref:Na/K ATPase alpha 1 subunit n=1 Tax=Apiospora hydei TaxID=1337664 RepID=A0ABR1UXU1_9PEZI